MGRCILDERIKLFGNFSILRSKMGLLFSTFHVLLMGKHIISPKKNRVIFKSILFNLAHCFYFKLEISGNERESL